MADPIQVNTQGKRSPTSLPEPGAHPLLGLDFGNLGCSANLSPGDGTVTRYGTDKDKAQQPQHSNKATTITGRPMGSISVNPSHSGKESTRGLRLV